MKKQTTSNANYWNYGDESSKIRVFALVIVMLVLWVWGSASKRSMDQYELEQRKFEEREQQKQLEESQKKALEQKRRLDEEQARNREFEQQQLLAEQQASDQERAAENEWIIWHCKKRSYYHGFGLRFQKCKRGVAPTWCFFRTGKQLTDAEQRGLISLGGDLSATCDWEEWRGEIPPGGRSPF